MFILKHFQYSFVWNYTRLVLHFLLLSPSMKRDNGWGEQMYTQVTDGITNSVSIISHFFSRQNNVKKLRRRRKKNRIRIIYLYHFNFNLPRIPQDNCHFHFGVLNKKNVFFDEYLLTGWGNWKDYPFYFKMSILETLTRVMSSESFIFL